MKFVLLSFTKSDDKAKSSQGGEAWGSNKDHNTKHSIKRKGKESWKMSTAMLGNKVQTT